MQSTKVRGDLCDIVACHVKASSRSQGIRQVANLTCTMRLVLRWTEHDPMEIWDSVTACVDGAIAAAGDVEVCWGEASDSHMPRSVSV